MGKKKLERVFDHQQILSAEQIELDAAGDIVDRYRRNMVAEIGHACLMQDTIAKIAWSYEAFKSRGEDRPIKGPQDRRKGEHLIVRVVVVTKPA